MNNINPIEYALMRCVGDEIRASISYPFQQMGGIVATDGHCLLCVTEHIDGLRDKYGKQDSPNCHNVMVRKDITTYRGDLTFDMMMLNPTEDRLVNICGTYVSCKEYNRVVEITQMLGLSGWNVYQGSERLMFVAQGVSLLVMGIRFTDNVKAMDIVLGDAKGEYAMDLSLGLSFCEAHQEKKERKREEMSMKRHGNLWEVRVAKYAYFYVEAADREEAERLARKNCDDADDDIFEDSDIEYEGVQNEVTADEVPEGIECIYTMDGWMDRDEYIDTLTEEEC